MEGPIGYPPPTLVRKRSGSRKLRILVLLLIVALGFLAFAVARTMLNQPAAPAPAPAPEPEAAPPAAEAPPPAAAEPQPEAAPVPAAPPEPAVTVEEPVTTAAAPVQPSGDARQANQWYYVARLGDGPGAIYSRTGGQWNFALACVPQAKSIEVIAVGTGDPRGFEQQQITVGTYKLNMDATYSKDGGGTIVARLPANHALFDALDGSTPMEVQLVADRKTVVPIGPAAVRLIRTCRGRG